MDLVSNWNLMDGASQDGIVLGTHNDAYAGNWADEPVSHGHPYICEKNDQ